MDWGIDFEGFVIDLSFVELKQIVSQEEN